MNENELIEVMERSGAILRGHFRLTSGRHSDLYVEKFRLFERPRLAQSLGEAMAHLFEDDFDLVASPAVGAIVPGFVTALAAEKRVIFAERVDNAMVFRRGFEVRPHERVLVIEDVITTGSSAREVVELVRAAGGKVVGVGAVLDRAEGGSPPDVGAPLRALGRLVAESWDESLCPLCAADQPLLDPGSRRTFQ